MATSVEKLRRAKKYGRHPLGAKLDETKPRLTTFDTADEASNALLAAIADRAPSDVICWLLSELADTARWTRAAGSGPDPAKIPRGQRKAALLASVGAYIDALAADLEAAPGSWRIAPADEDRVRWIMEEAARQHFACSPPSRAKRDEAPYTNDSLDRMHNWTRAKNGARHAPRVLPYAPQRLAAPDHDRVEAPYRRRGARRPAHAPRRRLPRRPHSRQEPSRRARGAVPRMTWYQATRHTFASHWVLSGGSIEKPREFLGHCSVTVTERYAHLRRDLFAQRDLATIALDLRAGGADPVHLGHDWPTVRGEVA